MSAERHTLGGDASGESFGGLHARVELLCSHTQSHDAGTGNLESEIAGGCRVFSLVKRAGREGLQKHSCPWLTGRQASEHVYRKATPKEPQERKLAVQTTNKAPPRTSH